MSQETYEETRGFGSRMMWKRKISNNSNNSSFFRRCFTIFFKRTKNTIFTARLLNVGRLGIPYIVAVVGFRGPKVAWWTPNCSAFKIKKSQSPTDQVPSCWFYLAWVTITCSSVYLSKSISLLLLMSPLFAVTWSIALPFVSDVVPWDCLIVASYIPFPLISSRLTSQLSRFPHFLIPHNHQKPTLCYDDAQLELCRRANSASEQLSNLLFRYENP